MACWLSAGRASCGRQAHRRLLGEQRRGRDPDQTPRRPVEVEGDEDEEADEHCRGDDRDEAPAEHREVEREQAEREPPRRAARARAPRRARGC